MSRFPPDNNNNNSMENDLEIIENAMNSMMQGAFSSLFKQLIDTSIFETTEPYSRGGSAITVIDGNNSNEIGRIGGTMPDYGGDDFRILANKHKHNKPISSTSDIATNTRTIANNTTQPLQEHHPSIIKSIFNRLLHKDENTQSSKEEIISRDIMEPDYPLNRDNNAHWTFTSSSQKTVYQPDGSQITTITTKTNDKTETIQRIRYPDGHIEERRDEMVTPSIWERLWRK
ncbi:hypothetical protein BDB01DRAFT_848407 [Pilobolus umbonatus]|nr:hypothetical protein BDB01DRAFT_848407 [Pilobolus umbonatus]